MLDRDIIEEHIKRYRQILDELGPEHLKHYVYALKDPRDGKVFYVGEGERHRVLQHFDEALAAEGSDTKKKQSLKTRRIAEVWHAGELVDWQIVSRGYLTQEEARIAEAAVINGISISQNGPLLNIQAGMYAATRGPIMRDELKSVAAKPVKPSEAFQSVFVFPIQNALSGRANGDVYEATRGNWIIGNRWRTCTHNIAVGVDRGLSKGAFRIQSWEAVEGNRYRFNGESLPDHHEFMNARWSHILDAARGFYQRGNWIAVDFDEAGRFCVRRGSATSEWLEIE